MKTVLITGCSSGFGLDSARDFLGRGWSVVATMRRPDPTLLPVSDRLRLLPLDVTAPDSIAAAVQVAGPIDVLVNNAGVGWLSVFEGTSDETIRRLFETNTFGTFAMIRAVLPQMRDRGAGVIVNVSSSVTMKPLPLLSVYTASKAAVNAYTECLALELAPLGIRTRLVLPGQAPGTQFGSNARGLMADAPAAPEAYKPFVAEVMGNFQKNAAQEPTRPGDVVQAIWRAVTDPDCPLHLPAGSDAEALAA
ncbi:SDR family oxidoreductase [Puniceibacterium sp. IMCC21224]|uniref:SDR family oxidoreductase n=1 Tax=Puniceibacterium sp. IMCC21224 TaxID=1618204 RepID=UPI00064DFB35|nr:SDR family oxidoreductase [Puniceibacterium sp. IMCC21224]KMK68307.1 short chain dehydrogenase [Puniceibacterium sp. IMCC21224]